MGKIGCHCGATIVDQAVPNPQMAYVLSDSDYLSLRESDSGDGADRLAEVGERSRELFQCDECGRLYLSGTGDKLYAFLPEDPQTPKSLLWSTDDDRRQYDLYGHWDAATSSGELTWDNDLETHQESYHTWEALRARYHELFGELSGRRLLYHAALDAADGSVVHEWFDETHGEE